MALPIFPTSPLPANLGRQLNWANKSVQYDSGAYQGSTPYVKPLTMYDFSMSNVPVSKQSSLSNFFNDRKGTTLPFLVQDPYEYATQGAVVVNTGTNPSSFMIKTNSGWPIFPKSGSTRLTSALSGALTQGSHWVLDADTGIVVASMRPSSADYWTVTSCEYYRKCVFVNYTETSPIWQVFNIQCSFKEIVIP